MRNHQNPHSVQLTLIQDELQYTVKEIHDIFGTIATSIHLSKDVVMVKKLSRELTANYTYLVDYYRDFIEILDILTEESAGDTYVMKVIEKRQESEMNFKSVSKRVMSSLKDTRIFLRSNFIHRQGGMK